MKLQEWQRGNDSDMTSLQRMEAHNEWLERMREEVRDSILSKIKPSTEEVEVEIVGFIRD